MEGAVVAWILGIIIGLAIGALLAWWFLDRRHKEETAGLNKEWTGRLDAANAETESARADAAGARDDAEAARGEAAASASDAEAARGEAAAAAADAEAARSEAAAANAAAEQARAEAATADANAEAARGEAAAAAADAEAARSEAAAANAAAEAARSEAASANQDAETARAETQVALADDNLTKIEGIGPTIAGVLNESGIVKYSGLARASTEALQAILDRAGPRYRIHDPSTWPEQASLAAAGDMDALKDLQERLKGGRE
jgi:predicted flap endonuclease-1-like 5' DNA nuclease